MRYSYTAEKGAHSHRYDFGRSSGGNA